MLPTISTEDVRSHSTADSCYVTIGTKVYDITTFLDDHPGGAELILEYGGRDVGKIMAGDGTSGSESHAHSDSAYEMLEEHLVGFTVTPKVLDVAARSARPGEVVPLPPSEKGLEEIRREDNDDDDDDDDDGSTSSLSSSSSSPPSSSSSLSSSSSSPVYARTGMSSAADLSRDTDYRSDFRTHKFLDLERPLFMQVWRGGFSRDFYLEQIHRPRHYKGGRSAPLFGNFLEPLSLTPWWVVPALWLPPVAYGSFLGYRDMGSPPAVVTAYWFLGLGIWTLVEYVLHRCLFHLDNHLPSNRVGITAHFLLHGIHHYLPMDKYRLVMPPTLFIVLALPFWKLAHTLFFYNWFVAVTVFCGGVFGYISYDMTHYFLHHRNLPAYYRELKKYHLQHHFADYENGFGVTSRFWDRIFGTELPPVGGLKAS